MGIVQKDALRTTLVTYLGMILGYVNKVFLFLWLLSTEEIGLINLIFALGMLFAQFANLGTINSTVKFFPFVRNESRNHYGFLSLNLLIVSAGIFIVATLVFLCGDLISTYFSERSKLFVDYYLWVIPVGIGTVLYKLLDSYLRALYKNVFSVLANEIIFRLVQSVLLAFYAFDVFTFDQLLIAFCLSQFIPGLLLIYYLHKIGEWHLTFKGIEVPRKLRKLIRNYALFSYINSLGAVVVVSLDSIMIAIMLGLSANGVYSTVALLIGVLAVPYASIMRVSVPIVAGHWKTKNMVEMDRIYKQVSSVSLFIGLFLFMAVWVNRFELFSFLKPEFAPGIYVFLALMCGRLLDMYFGLNGSILVTSKKYKYDMIFTSLLIIAVLLLNLVFIPKWEMVGAAISTSIAYFGYNIARLIFVWYNYKIHPFTRSQLAVFVVFAANVALFHFLPIDVNNVWGNMVLKMTMLTVLFALPIYAFRLEPEVVNYANKVKDIVFAKLKR